jgi:hypothetical protein
VHGWHNGVAYTRGRYESESQARAMGAQMFSPGDDYVAEELPTSDLNRAKAIFRDRDLHKMSLDEAMVPHRTATSPRDIKIRRPR